MIDHLEEYVKKVAEYLSDHGIDFALIGGIAVSLRTVERFTKDVDFAVSVNDDKEAESIVNSLLEAGFQISTFLERDVDGRLATVRLTAGGEVEVFVDLLFATAGIEKEVTAAATPMEVFRGFVVKIASVSGLIAMKLLSANWDERPQDVLDLQYLIKAADGAEISEAKELVRLITSRGYDRGKDLELDFDHYIERFRK